MIQVQSNEFFSDQDFLQTLATKKQESVDNYQCEGKLDLISELKKDEFLRFNHPVIYIKNGKVNTLEWKPSKNSVLQDSIDIFWTVAIDRQTQPSQKQRKLMNAFLKNRAGQIWLRLVIEELMDFTIKGYIKLDLKIRNGEVPLVQAITSELTEDGEFEIAGRMFRIKFNSGWGASAYGSAINIGNISSKFSMSGQKVDPIAIISHEFGHTRFGNMANADSETILGEACTVKLYENPVRLLNNYAPRTHYYSKARNCYVDIDSFITSPIDKDSPTNCID